MILHVKKGTFYNTLISDLYWFRMGLRMKKFDDFLKTKRFVNPLEVLSSFKNNFLSQ